MITLIYCQCSISNSIYRYNCSFITYVFSVLTFKYYNFLVNADKGVCAHQSVTNVLNETPFDLTCLSVKSMFSISFIIYSLCFSIVGEIIITTNKSVKFYFISNIYKSIRKKNKFYLTKFKPFNFI